MTYANVFFLIVNRGALAQLRPSRPVCYIVMLYQRLNCSSNPVLCVNSDTSFPWESETFWLFSGSPLEVGPPPNRSSRKMAQPTWIHVRMCLL